MWSVGDTKDLASFLGQSTAEFTRAAILGFSHDDLADGSGKVGITFKLPYTSATYSHTTLSTTNINGISWVGSTIRKNSLKNGENAYTYDPSVTSSTSGTYYTLNADNETFTAVTLPDAFVSGQKYFALTTLTADGAFITGLPSDLLSVIKQVKKKTWGGFGLTAGSNDNTIINTKDWLFLLSDCEVFGTENRFATAYSKNTLEGAQYDFYKTYAENKLRSAQTQWLRSPYPTSGTNFAYWNNNGYVNNNNANNANRVAP
jgi:hypothetical protein